MGTQKSLSLPGRLEFPHSPLPHSGRLMGLLDSIVGILVSHMDRFRDDLPMGDPITSQLIGDDLPGFNAMAVPIEHMLKSIVTNGEV